MDDKYKEENFEASEEITPKKKSRIWSVCALILAVLSVILFFLPAVSITLGVLAVIFAVVSRFSIGYFDNYGIASIIVGIFGAVFGIAYIIYDVAIASLV